MAFIRRLCGVAAVALAPCLAIAQQGVLEVPGPNSSQSGIGVISGWHCSGQRIEISINGGAKMVAGSRTPRDDAAGICGRSDTGFSLLFNWNLLPPTGVEIDLPPYHRVTAYADGIQFAESKVAVVKFGYFTEYLTGKKGAYVLHNFPNPGNSAEVTWDQDKQNFTITRTNSNTDGNGGTGTYYGAVITHGCAAPPGQVRPGNFVVKTEGGQMQVRLNYADGNVCELPSAPIEASQWSTDGFIEARFGLAATAACPDLAGQVVKIGVNGRVLQSTAGPELCSVNLTGATLRLQ